MKKFFYIAAAILTLGLNSCSSENEVVDEAVETTPASKLIFKANIGNDTRATIEGTKVSFEVGDRVGLFSKDNNNVILTVTSVSEGTAILEGEGVVNSTMYAVYPYNAEASQSGNYVYGYSLSKSKSLTAGAYPSDAVSLATCTDGETLNFQNLCAIFKLTFDSYAHSCDYKLGITSYGSESLWGDISINLATASISHYSNNWDHTFNFGNLAEDGASYYISVIPTAVTTLYMGNDLYSVNKEVNKTLDAGKIYNIAINY